MTLNEHMQDLNKILSEDPANSDKLMVIEVDGVNFELNRKIKHKDCPNIVLGSGRLNAWRSLVIRKIEQLEHFLKDFPEA